MQKKDSPKIAPFQITSRAIEEVKTILTSKNIPEGYHLRVGIKGSGGCSGVDFVLGFDKTNGKDDIFEIDGISVLMEKGHALYLAGKEIDFEDSATARG